MYPHITYDEQHGLAYVAFSGNEIKRSIESEDELFILDVDKDGQLVGIEILSVLRLQRNFSNFFNSKEENFSPEMIPAYIIPFVFSHYKMSQVAQSK
jgi:uncharacterized protein YuzE